MSIELMLPLESPIKRNEVVIDVDGKAAATHTVDRGPAKTVEIELPPGSPNLTFTATRSFVPAEVPESLSRDARRLAVKLLGLSTRAAGAPAAQPGA